MVPGQAPEGGPRADPHASGGAERGQGGGRILAASPPAQGFRGRSQGQAASRHAYRQRRAGGPAPGDCGRRALPQRARQLDRRAGRHGAAHHRRHLDPAAVGRGARLCRARPFVRPAPPALRRGVHAPRAACGARAPAARVALLGRATAATHAAAAHAAAGDALLRPALAVHPRALRRGCAQGARLGHGEAQA